MSLGASVGTFGSGTVANLRGLAMLSLTDFGLVGVSSFITDDGGGGTVTWTYGSFVTCRIDPLPGAEGVVADRVSDRSTHLITLPPTTPISTESRFVCNDVTYEITAVRTHTVELMRFAEAVPI